MQKAVFLSDEELKRIQSMNAEFSKIKTALGDLELQKQQILFAANDLKSSFAIHEKQLIEKYGQEAIINIQTGEVTQKNN